jgi:hypothetical protein
MNTKSILFAAVASTLVSIAASNASANTNDPKVAIATLDARLAGSVDVPAMFFGARKINNNYDVVDEIRKTTGASATIFVKSGDDFIRVSTNVLTPEGKRGVGTPLARAKAYEAVNKGQQFCGPVDVLGTAFDACYNPIKDASGKIIGVSYVGYKK